MTLSPPKATGPFDKYLSFVEEMGNLNICYTNAFLQTLIKQLN